MTQQVLPAPTARFQGGSAAASISQDSLWQIDLASAKSAPNQDETAEPSASFAQTLQQKKRQDAPKDSDKTSTDETSTRHDDLTKTHRKRAKKPDAPAGADAQSSTPAVEDAGNTKQVDDGEK